MDNAQKAIMIGVGLFITIIIIAAVMLITGMGQNLLNKGQSQVNGISASLQNDLFEQYNGKKMSGAQVRTAAVQLKNRDDAASITIKIGGSEMADTAAINSATSATATKMYTGTVQQNLDTGIVTIEWN